MPTDLINLAATSPDAFPSVSGEYAHLVERLHRFEAIMNLSPDLFTLLPESLIGTTKSVLALHHDHF